MYIRHFIVLLLLTAMLLASQPREASAQCDGEGNATLLLKRSCEIGATLKLRLTGPPNAKYRIWKDLGSGPTEVPGIGTFCLDFGPDLEVIKSGHLNNLGRTGVFTQIPDDPSIIGRTFSVQFAAKDSDSDNGVAISNAYNFEICDEGDNGDCDGGIGCLEYITVVEYDGDFPVEIDTRVFKSGDESELLGAQTFEFDPANAPLFPIGSLEEGLIVRRINISGEYLLIHTTATALLRGGSDPEFHNSSTFETTVGDVVLSQDIHLSCSQPIGAGFRFGPIFITGLTREAGCVPDLCDDGKPCSLIMRYTGDSCDATTHTQDDGKVTCDGDPAMEAAVLIRATNKENPTDGTANVWFEGEVALGEQFVLESFNAGEDKLDSATFIHIFDLSDTLLQSVEFHTSCSQPLHIGDQFGAARLEGFTREGLCEDPNGVDECEGNKPQVLTMEYTGEDCSATVTTQDPDKVNCDGDPAFAPTVRIRASDKVDPMAGDALVWFDGAVDLDTTFDIDATAAAGETRLKNATFVHIFDLDDNLLQSVEFHTSCSQPLRIGDQFGAVKLQVFVAE